MIETMCIKGQNCECAKSQSVFDASLNTIGATAGLAGLEALRMSRSLELQEFKQLVKADQVVTKNLMNSRRALIQISQCPGIGKTTFLGLLSRDFCNTLAETANNEVVEPGGIEVIGSLVTFNGIYMSSVIKEVPIQAALCSRVLYGALSCHSAFPGKRCQYLRAFDLVAKLVAEVHQECPINVIDTRKVLWRWFGSKPIFVGIDEALKCSDGTEEQDKKLQALLTASGAFLDTASDMCPVYVVMSSLSPDRFLRATYALNRVVDNIVVYPVDRKAGVKMLDSIIKSISSNMKVDNEVLVQMEALTVGHPRAIERTGIFISTYVKDVKQLSSGDAAQGLYIPLVDYLASGTSNALASRPEPFVLEYLISRPPEIWTRGATRVMGTQTVLIDDLIYSGQVLVISGSRPTLTIAGWWLFTELKDQGRTPLDISSVCPSASLLRAAYKSTKNSIVDVPGTLYEAFSIFFVAEAMRRGGATLKDVVPHLYLADSNFCLPRDAISVETMTIPSYAIDVFGKAQLVRDRINMLRNSYPTAGSKGIILIMPPNFPALDAIVVAGGIVIGVQIESAIEESRLMKKIDDCRMCLMEWKAQGCDILGADELLLFSVGVETKPAGLQLRGNEVLVSAKQLRVHFVDVFFRCGLTFGEGD